MLAYSYSGLAQGIIVLDLELREGSRIFSPSSPITIRSLVTLKQGLSSTRRGYFGPRHFSVSVQMFSVIKVSTSVHT